MSLVSLPGPGRAGSAAAGAGCRGTAAGMPPRPPAAPAPPHQPGPARPRPASRSQAALWPRHPRPPRPVRQPQRSRSPRAAQQNQRPQSPAPYWDKPGVLLRTKVKYRGRRPISVSWVRPWGSAGFGLGTCRACRGVPGPAELEPAGCLPMHHGSQAHRERTGIIEPARLDGEPQQCHIVAVLSASMSHRCGSAARAADAGGDGGADWAHRGFTGSERTG